MGTADLLTHKPKLVVVIVIDQFRADYLTRFAPRFLSAKKGHGQVGGFKYLTSTGAYFPFAEYDILQSMTGPGHATILTGSYPYQNGIALNDWYDRDLNRKIYCAEDIQSPLVTSTASPSSAATGMSPRNLIGTTVGDELKNAGYPSRVVSLALKDRAAIMMGGHRADLAMWFDPKAKQWISSRYYLPDGKLPSWITDLNVAVKKLPPAAAVGIIAAPGTGLSLKDPMASDNYYIKALGGKDHALDSAAQGAELTVQAAEGALAAYRLGQGEATDILALSFSSHDYLGHGLGPNSREMEELTVQEDRAISRLLNSIQKSVPGGLKQTLIILTGDHGIPPNPDWLKSQRIDAGFLDEKALTQSLNEHLEKKFGHVDGGWISFTADLNFFFNSAAIAAKKPDRLALENEARAVLLEATHATRSAATPATASASGGVAHIFTATDVRERKLPAGMHERQILHTFFAGRSGDVIIIPKPFYMSAGATVTHMTGYSYDRLVPLVMAGPHIRAGLYATPAHVVDIAPTLSFLLGTLPHALSEGRVLSETIGD